MMFKLKNDLGKHKRHVNQELAGTNIQFGKQDCTMKMNLTFVETTYSIISNQDLL